jgi:hypothetical protein
VHDQAGRVCFTGEHDRRALTVDLGQLAAGDLQPLRLVGLEHPAAVRGDPDRHHVVAVAVDRRQHAARGDAGDRVLTGATAEHQRDARLPAASGGG